MLLRDIDGWPPVFTDSFTTKTALPVQAPALLKRCKVYMPSGTKKPYLSIVVQYQGRDWHTMVTDHPEPMLRRIEATLRGHEGEPLSDLAKLKLVESK